MSNDRSLREALHRCLSADLTFAAFRRPGAPVSIWAQRTPDMETVDGSLLWELNDIFLLAPFTLKDDRVAMIRSDVDLSFGELGSDILPLYECVGSKVDHADLPLTTDEASYKRSVELAKEAITRGHLHKVVLSRTIRVGLEHDALMELFMDALIERPDAFVTLMHTPDHGTWLGASPERLVFEEEDLVRVDALAGTMPSNDAPDEPRQWGEKERNEQDLVATSVLRTFEDLGLKSIVSRGPEVMRAGEVAHLRTSIEADLGERTLSDLVLALHPTPAICGTPKPAAQSFIAEYEAHDRQLYAGFWGPWSPDGHTELFVNIRCLQALRGEAVLYVGAGITEGSDPDLEWKETEQKARTWLRPIVALKK